MKIFLKLLFLLVCCALILARYLTHENLSDTSLPVVSVIKQDLQVNVKVVGELEAARSTLIASSIKGDQGKIIDLIADGLTVEPGQVLVKMDPTPFEEKIEKIKTQLKEQEACIMACTQTLKWEISQAEHENRLAIYEIETAQLELNKMIYGDGPQEISRLKSAMQKAWLKFDEIQAYSNDLIELETQGFLNPSEVKQAQKRLGEEKEVYEMAKLQYESYAEHVLPMQIKKMETSLKRASMNQEEIMKAGRYQVMKAEALLEQTQQALIDYALQLHQAEKELAETEIVAPAPGMVVHREDYRSGQRRKPRVGDVLIKNQPLIELPDLNSMIVKTRVREVDLFKVHVGKKATIEVDAYPQLILEGTIASLGVLALADAGRSADEKYFEVRIALETCPPCLRPGMTTRATIHAQDAQDVLTVPLQAIFSDHNQNYCYVACAERGFEKKEVQVGISNEQWAEVTTGLQEGDCVCLMNPFHEKKR